jgi:hypothetical protein
MFAEMFKYLELETKGFEIRDPEASMQICGRMERMHTSKKSFYHFQDVEEFYHEPVKAVNFYETKLIIDVQRAQDNFERKNYILPNPIFWKEVFKKCSPDQDLAIVPVRNYEGGSRKLQKSIAILKMFSDEAVINQVKTHYPDVLEEEKYMKQFGSLPHFFKEEKIMQPLIKRKICGETFCKRIQWKDVLQLFWMFKYKMKKKRCGENW